MLRYSDGSIQLYIHHRAINECTINNSLLIPRIDDLIHKLREAPCITQLHLRSAYIGVKMSDDDTDGGSIVTTSFKGLAPRNRNRNISLTKRVC